MQAHCPRCNSDQTQRLQLIYEGGLQLRHSTGVAVGGYMGSARGEAVFLTGSSGTQQSVLSARATPPARRSNGCATAVFAVFVTVGFIALVIAVSAGGGYTFGIICLLVAALAIPVMVSANSYNTKVWPRLVDAWGRTFMCMRCGHAFIPELQPVAASQQALPEPRRELTSSLTLPSNAATTSTRFCANCGTRMPAESARFCFSCGTPTSSQLPSEGVANPSNIDGKPEV